MSSIPDVRMERLLEAILKELQEIRKIIAEPTTPAYPNMPAAPAPYVPARPYAPVPGWPEDRRNCAKCGINMVGAMGYVCQNMDCPSGCGPTTY